MGTSGWDTRMGILGWKVPAWDTRMGHDGILGWGNGMGYRDGTQGWDNMMGHWDRDTGMGHEDGGHWDGAMGWNTRMKTLGWGHWDGTT